jgi:hypothetical protein
MGLLRVVVLAALAALCGCEGCDPGDVVDAPGAVKQTLSASWKVVDLDGTELACEQVDAQFVTVSFFRPVTGEAFNEVFDCFRKAGTRDLDEGEYLIGFELADRFGTLVAVSPRRFQVRGDTTLEEVTFRIEPSGALAFTVEAIGQAANCEGGANITGMTIELYQAGGACETTTLMIESVGPYLVSCTAPNATGCLEKGQEVSGTNLPAGEYRLRVVGLQSAIPCWEHDQLHRVRAAGLGRSLVLPLRKICN